MTISSSAGITMETSGSQTVTGWQSVSFGTSGATITVGTDVGLSTGVGDVSEVAGDLAKFDRADLSAGVGLANDEGAGIGLATSFGDASVSLAYVMNSDVDASLGVLNDSDSSGASIEISTTVGQLGLTAGYATMNGDTDDTETGISATYDSGMGAISVGYGQSTGDTDGTVASFAYSMSLDADTSLAVGYGVYNQDEDDSTLIDVSLSRSLGGGASIFADYSQAGGDTDGGNQTGLAIGTSVSF